MLRLIVLLLLGLCLGITPNLHPIKCINYYGFETERRKPVCDWVHQPDFYLRTLKEYLEINTIRLPFSYQYVHDDHIEDLDNFVNLTSSYNIQVILDYHRTWANHQGPIPTEGITISKITEVWFKLANRYYQNPFVLGLGIFNEYQGQNTTYLNLYHESIIRYVEKHFPGRYYYFIGCSNWGHDCNNITYRLPGIREDRILIDFHTYHFTFTSEEKQNLEQAIDKQLPLSIPSSNIFVGELGWKQDVSYEKDWAIKTLNHFKSRNISSVCGWTIAHSHDSGGWFNDDCLTFRYDKADILKAYWNPFIPSIPTPNPTCPPCPPCNPSPHFPMPWIPHVPWPN